MIMASLTDSMLLEAEPGYAVVGFKLKEEHSEEQHTSTTDRGSKEAFSTTKLQRGKHTVQATSRHPAGGSAAETRAEGANEKKCLARADTLIRSGNNKEAIQHLEAALNDTTDIHLQKQIWRLLGNCHSSTRSYKKASVAYLHYLGMCRELGDFPGATRAYCCLGIAFMHQRLYTLAANCFLQYLENSQISRNTVAMASAYNNLGVLCKLLGKKGIDRAYHTGSMSTMDPVMSRLHRAISYFGEHLIIVEQLCDRTKQCVAFGNLGACYEMLMEYPQAVHYHYQRLVLTYQLRDYRGQSRALCNIGNCLRAQGQLGEACVYYLKDLEVCRLIKDERGEVVALLNLATTSEALADLHKSIEWHSLILGIRVKRDDKPGQVKSLMLLGALYYETEQLIKAKDYFTRVVDLAQILRDHELQVKSLLILEEVQRAIKKQKHSRYNSVRKSLRRFKKRSLRSLLPAHSNQGVSSKQQKYEVASGGSLSQLGGSGDTPMIKPRMQKDRVKLGSWSPGLKRWVNESGCTTLHGEGSSTGWAPSPMVIQNTMTTNSVVDDHDTTCDEASHFSLRDSVHGHLNENKQLSYQLEDVLMSAAANPSDVEVELQRATSSTSLYSRAFGSLRHIQELRVISQDICKPAVELGLSDGGNEMKEWVLSPGDDRKSVQSLPIDETMFDSQQHPQSTAHQITVQLEQSQPHPSPDQAQQSPTHNLSPHSSKKRPRSFKNQQQPCSHDYQSHSHTHQPCSHDHQQSHDQQPRLSDQQNNSLSNAVRRPISPVDVLEGVEAVISCLEAVLENEDHSDSEP